GHGGHLRRRKPHQPPRGAELPRLRWREEEGQGERSLRPRLRRRKEEGQGERSLRPRLRRRKEERQGQPPAPGRQGRKEGRRGQEEGRGQGQEEGRQGLWRQGRLRRRLLRLTSPLRKALP